MAHAKTGWIAKATKDREMHETLSRLSRTFASVAIQIVFA
jgi:hypothetical protein